MQQERLTLSVPEAAAALGVGRTSLYRAIQAGRVRVLRIGRKPKLRVPRVELEALARNPERFSRESAKVSARSDLSRPS